MKDIILNWLKKNLAFILGGLAIFIMVACFVSGCQYHKHQNPCPEPTIVTNTVLIHDTIIHEIVDTFPFYIIKNDTIIYIEEIPAVVDTAKILADYFALHVYSRSWTDSLLTVDLRDTVTQNRFLQNEFKYKILRPQAVINTTVDNSVNYYNYLYAGIDFPFYNAECLEFSVLSAFKRGYIGVGYAPMQKGISIKTGVRLFSWQ